MISYVVSIIVFIISILMFFISFRSFRKRGFLFNNAYIHASKKERETMDKTPHYRQSSIVFFLLGVLFLIIGIDTILETKWLFYLEIFCEVIIISYAIVSSLMIEKKKG